MVSTSTRPTFAERYCHYFEIPEEGFVRHLLSRSLHFPLRWLWSLSPRLLTDFLEPDIACVQAAGRMRKRRELEGELAEFSYHPRNRLFLRRFLQQRLSTRRMRRVLRELPDE